MQTLIDFDSQLFMMLNGSDSSFVDGIMMVITNGITWIPLYIALLLLVIKNNESMTQIVIFTSCAIGCVLLSTIAADFIAKPLIERWRPSSDPLINCYSRIYLGAHYPSDVVVGLLVGAIIAVLFYLLSRKLFFKISSNFNYVSTQYSATGYSVTDIDMVLTVIGFLYILVIIIPLL